MVFNRFRYICMCHWFITWLHSRPCHKSICLFHTCTLSHHTPGWYTGNTHPFLYTYLRKCKMGHMNSLLQWSAVNLNGTSYTRTLTTATFTSATCCFIRAETLGFVTFTIRSITSATRAWTASIFSFTLIAALAVVTAMAVHTATLARRRVSHLWYATRLLHVLTVSPQSNQVVSHISFI